MAGLSDTAETALLDALLRNSVTNLQTLNATTLYLRAYTADPTDSGSATSNEATYGGYNGVALTSATAWSGSGNSRTNAGVIQFPTWTSGSNTITHFAVCTTQSGAGTIISVHAQSPSLVVASGSNETVRLPIGALSISISGVPAGTASACLDALLENDETALNALIGATRYLRAHSADPSAGSAVTSELSYTGYDGVAVASTVWTSSGNPRTNQSAITFPTCTAGSGSLTHTSLCTTQNGAGSLIWVFARSGALTINSSTNATPEAAISDLSASFD
jgi:hypothetical protein